MNKISFAIAALLLANSALAQFNDIGAKKAPPVPAPTPVITLPATTGLAPMPAMAPVTTPAVAKSRVARVPALPVSASSLAYLATFTSIFEEGAKR